MVQLSLRYVYLKIAFFLLSLTCSAKKSMREKKKIEDATKKKKTNYKNACAFVALDNSYETGHSL